MVMDRRRLVLGMGGGGGAVKLVEIEIDSAIESCLFLPMLRTVVVEVLMNDPIDLLVIHRQCMPGVE